MRMWLGYRAWYWKWQRGVAESMCGGLERERHRAECFWTMTFVSKICFLSELQDAMMGASWHCRHFFDGYIFKGSHLFGGLANLQNSLNKGNERMKASLPLFGTGKLLISLLFLFPPSHLLDSYLLTWPRK